jgi:lipoprotein-releasing system ATP-binding protein
MSNIILNAFNISKSYQDAGQKIQVLHHLNLSLETGKIIAIVGSSGSGKSTLLHILGGLDKADAGRVIIDEQDITAMSEKKRCQFRNQFLGFIYQFHHLLPEFTVLENVSMPGWIGKNSPEEVKKNALNILDRVGLFARAHHRMAELSGGERQRAAIARALVMKPKCILADELTGNLDRNMALTILYLMKELSQESKTSMILVTHDLSLAALCDECYTLSEGRLK